MNEFAQHMMHSLEEQAEALLERVPDALEKPIPNFSRLTKEDIALMLKLRDAGKTQVEIAQVIGCSQPTVSQTLAEFIDTRLEAANILRGGASELAKRIVKKAGPMVALETLRDLEVSQKRAPDQGKGGGVTVVIGVQDSDVQVQITQA